MKQPDKMTAYYYRAAQKVNDLYLDNQMRKLLHHATESGDTAFALYVDNGYNGLSFDRPAVALLQQHMKGGFIQTVVAAGLSRISRNTADILSFAGFADECGVSIETLDGDHKTLDMSKKLYAALAAKGGERR